MTGIGPLILLWLLMRGGKPDAPSWPTPAAPPPRKPKVPAMPAAPAVPPVMPAVPHGVTDQTPQQISPAARTEVLPPAENVRSVSPGDDPVKAALELLRYVKAGRPLGTRSDPSAFVATAQRAMGLKADGIYGPATRARGKELTGKSFPPRGAVTGSLYIP